MARLDKHDKIHHELFDENTEQVGSLGDIVEAHAGDAVFLTPDERSVGGADGGEADFEAEMLATDPNGEDDIDPEDVYTDNEDQIWATDQTGTVEGIARGFGTHLPQDLGREGFHVEEMPDAALKYQNRVVHAGEELDDYDDDGEGVYDQDEQLATLSQPGVNDINPAEGEPMPDRISVRKPRPRTFDERLDATREIK